MITVYGHSDDLIEIDGDIREEFSHYGHDADDEGALLAFSDGTVLRIKYTNSGVWRITPVAVTSGSAVLIEQAPEDDDDNYSDKATLGDVRWVVYGTRIVHGKRTTDG